MAELALRSGFPASGGPRSSLDRVRDALNSLGLLIGQERSNGFMACCPVHGDRTPSLNVTWKAGNTGGLVLLNCHAKCRNDEVVEALGLSLADLFDEPLPERERVFDRSSKSPARRRAGQRRGKQLGRLPALITAQAAPAAADDVDHRWVEVARYPYVTRDGRLVQEVIRQECTAEGSKHKNFPQVWITLDGRRLKTKPRDFTPVLYRAPQVAQAVRDGVEVWVLEGEKDVETAESFGLVATTNTQGGATFPDELVDELAGARVAVVLDRDATGWARGVGLHAKLTAVDTTVRLLLPDVDEAKADFTDHVESGQSVDDFIEVSVGLVQVWHELESELARARAKAKSLTQAVNEARARWELAEGGQDIEDNRRFAKRWVLETEIRHEALADLVTKVRGHALRAGAEWADATVDEADELLAEATQAARRVHHDVGIAVPESLLAPESAPAAPEGSRPTEIGQPADGNVTEIAPAPVGARADATAFRVIDDAIYQWDPDRTRRRRSEEDDDDENPGKLRQLLSMVVRVVAREYQEVENESSEVGTTELMGRSSTKRSKAQAPRTLTAVRLRYADPVSAEVMEIRVMADSWRDHSWLEALPGKPDYDHKRAGLDTLQRAILAISTEVVDEVLHRATGWRKASDGSQHFVHARGAITANGHRDMETSFSGPIGRFDLPDPVRDAQALRQAWLTCSATMLDRLPGRIAAPLLGHIFRAPLGGNSWNLALIGSPGTFKTSIASKAMHHFGERWEQDTPLSSMSGNGATFNASRQLLHLAKDTVAWLDDFAPTKSWLEAQKLLEETSRLIKNREARMRSSRDGQEVMPGTAPRTSGLFTSEVMPRPGSGGERMLVVPLIRGDIEPDQLFPLDDPMSRHGRALVMASFISWLAEDLDERRTLYLKIADTYAEDLVARDGEAIRQSAVLANTWVGWVAMCDFLNGTGAISDQERAETLQRVDQHLREAGKAAVDPDIPRTTGARVRELLGYALRNGIAFVDDARTGDAPPWPLAGRLGWRRTQLAEPSDGLPAKYRLDARGIKMGYVLHDPEARERRGQVLMCEPAQVEAVIKSAAATQVEKLEIDWKTAARALYDEGILLGDTSEAGRVRLVLKCRLYAEDNRDVRMAVLRLTDIIGEVRGDDEGDAEDEAGPGEDPGDGPGDGPEPGSSPAPAGRELQAIPGLLQLDDPQTVDAEDEGRQDQSNVTTTDHRDLMGSDHPHEEIDMSYPAEPDDDACVDCGYPTNTLLPTGNQWGDDPMHVSCWSRLMREGLLAADSPRPYVAAGTAAAEPTSTKPTASTGTPVLAAPRLVAVVSAPAVPVPLAAKAPAKPAGRPASAGKGPTTAVGKGTQRSGKAGAFRAAAAIADLDGIWLSGGERIDWPTKSLPKHVGQLQQLADYLNLGTQTTKYLSASGQIWIGADLARHMGIDATTIEAASEADRDKVAREMTADLPAVTEALAAGWKLGGDGKSLGRWTRVWQGSNKSVWLVLVPALPRAPKAMPLVSGSPDHATLAKRIGLLASALGAPFHHSAASTGLDLMKDLRRKDKDKGFFRVIDPVPPATIGNLESETNWCRTPTEEELEHTYVHAYDRAGSYLAGAAGLELGVGEAVHHPEGTAFVPKMPGLWLIEVPEIGDRRMPNPLDWRGNSAGRVRWRATPGLEFAFDQEYEPKILEAYTWPERARVLDPFYEACRDARTELDSWDPQVGDETDPDMKAARDQLKQIYSETFGMMGSEKYRAGKDDYDPARRLHVVSKSRTNVLRFVARTGRDYDRWPVAIVTDTVVYTSNEADPIKAWPGDPKKLGRALGQYKPEGTALLADHLQYLTGGRYTGRLAIVGDDRGE